MTVTGAPSSGSWQERISLGLRNLLFILLLPAAGAVYAPWWILTRGGGAWPRPAAWPAAALIVVGVGLYLWCTWVFAIAGHGTPAPWDAPRRVVATGPYRMVRNPIYVAAFLVIGGEAWLFLSPWLLIYLLVLALGVHLAVLWYEEPMLDRRFGQEYETYRRAVPRWIPNLAKWTRSGTER